MGVVKFLVILLLVLVSGFFYYQFTEPYIMGGTVKDIEKQNITILRAVDGDTVDSSIGKIRLLGINTPEKKQPYYQEAKDFMENYENKTIAAEVHEKDKYGRYLAYIFDSESGELVNKKQLELGYANLYYYGEDKYYAEMKKADEDARAGGIGIWKKSRDFGCIELINLQWNEGKERCVNAEQLVLNNKCEKTLNVIIKDSANHIEDENLSYGLFVKNYSCVWNDDGDAITIRDESGLLLYYSYP
jgi:micrococcal nuclease